MFELLPEQSYSKRILIDIKKILLEDRCQWLTPRILATWEAEIGRIVV
jgi:hypothetical protein